MFKLSNQISAATRWFASSNKNFQFSKTQISHKLNSDKSKDLFWLQFEFPQKFSLYLALQSLAIILICRLNIHYYSHEECNLYKSTYSRISIMSTLFTIIIIICSHSCKIFPLHPHFLHMHARVGVVLRERNDEKITETEMLKNK